MKKYNLPVIFPDILLPENKIDMNKWAVVACDQFTSNNAYWEELSTYIDGSPSTLNITFPEIYLSHDNSEKINEINDHMRQYIADNIFKTHSECAVLVDRSTPYNPKRLGVVLAVDLEMYSYIPEDKALIRATEGTILERIPPRVEIRRNAPLELPHILLLIDDEKKKVIEPLFNEVNEKLYDFNLNMNGGSIKGYKLSNKDKLISGLLELLNEDRIKSKYNGDKLLFGVGDGNHSLATAKTYWNEIKNTLSEAEQLTHPARFALVEIVNIYDEGIKFEPIHRAIFNIDAEDFLNKFREAFSCYNIPGIIKCGGRDCDINLPDNAIKAVSEVQKFCQKYQEIKPKTIIVYIHGDEEVERIGKEKNSLVIVLPKMSKEELFPYIVNEGVLPRKTFSMGEGNEKRYYIEARKIKK